MAALEAKKLKLVLLDAAAIIHSRRK